MSRDEFFYQNYPLDRLSDSQAHWLVVDLYEAALPDDVVHRVLTLTFSEYCAFEDTGRLDGVLVSPEIEIRVRAAVEYLLRHLDRS